jgi:acyl-CoA reductase-like NAD-dependent aldehyde dehydrogenase
LSTAVDVGPARGGARLAVVNPATGAVIREVAEDAPDAVARKFAKAARGQKEWARSRIDDRKTRIARLGHLVQERIEGLARTLTGEMGKPITQSRNEVKGLSARIDYFLANVHRVLAEEEAGADSDGRMQEKISYEPIGVVGNISAWNYPYFVGSNVFVPALLTGNAVLYKPSEFASLTGLAIGELMQEAGVPADVFQVVMGGGGAGAALLDQPLAGIFFTGSYATGRKVAESAARHLMRVQLELGGNAPVDLIEVVAVGG